MDTNDFLWGMYQENVTQGRQHEDHRASSAGTLTGLVTLGVGAVSLRQNSSPAFIVSLGLFVVVLGVLGVLLAFKHYERNLMHRTHARFYRKALEAILDRSRGSSAQLHTESGSVDGLQSLRRVARSSHESTRIHARYGGIALHKLYAGVQLCLAILGAALAVSALV